MGALAAALLVLVQDQLLQPLLGVPAVEVSLDSHLDLDRGEEVRVSSGLMGSLCTFFWRTLVAMHATGLSRSPHTPDIQYYLDLFC